MLHSCFVWITRWQLYPDVFTFSDLLKNHLILYSKTLKITKKSKIDNYLSVHILFFSHSCALIIFDRNNFSSLLQRHLFSDDVFTGSHEIIAVAINYPINSWLTKSSPTLHFCLFREAISLGYSNFCFMPTLMPKGWSHYTLPSIDLHSQALKCGR